VLEARKLGELCSPDRLYFGVHTRRRNNGAGNRVLILVEEGNVLQADQSEEVNVLFDISERVFVYVIAGSALGEDAGGRRMRGVGPG